MNFWIAFVVGFILVDAGIALGFFLGAAFTRGEMVNAEIDRTSKARAQVTTRGPDHGFQRVRMLP